jgi:signal transduction histidine kinase
MPFTQRNEKDRQAMLVQSMLDASLHGIMMLAPVRDGAGAIVDFTIEVANAAIVNQVGFAIDDSSRPRITDVFPKNEAYGFHDTYRTALETGTLQRRELYYEDERLTGWFDLGVAPVEDGVVVTFVNITETKRHQQQIEESATQLRAIMDIAQSGIFVFSPERDASGDVVDFRFTVSNPAFASYVGQIPEKLVGDLGSKWFPGYRSNGLFERYLETYRTGKSNRFDFHYDDDGIDVWLDIMSTKLGDGVLVTFTDYTTVKRLQLQLESSVQDLKRSNQSLEEFAYAASHDLQEPLRKIHFFSNRLKGSYGEGLGEDGASMLERMEVAARRMRTLIEDLLAFSKVSASNAEPQDVDLNLLINGVLSDLDRAVVESGAAISVDTMPVIRGDLGQLRQLFQNLLGNALKYRRHGVPPAVSITSSITKGKDSPLDVQPNDAATSYHLIVVTDNGVGFEMEYARKIFQLFQRLHGRAEYEGTGIGLAIVQKVAQNHKGYIDAVSVPGEGASFRILLPV